MAKLVLASFSLLLLSLSSLCYLASADDPNHETKYCVAKPSTNDTTLDFLIDDICGELKEECTLYIGDEGSCYQPNTKINHASVAMNLKYQANKEREDWDCYFNGFGLVTTTDPSYKSHGNTCTYKYIDKI